MDIVRSVRALKRSRVCIASDWELDSLLHAAQATAAVSGVAAGVAIVEDGLSSDETQETDRTGESQDADRTGESKDADRTEEDVAPAKRARTVAVRDDERAHSLASATAAATDAAATNAAATNATGAGVDSAEEYDPDCPTVVGVATPSPPLQPRSPAALEPKLPATPPTGASGERKLSDAAGANREAASDAGAGAGGNGWMVALMKQAMTASAAPSGQPDPAPSSGLALDPAVPLF
jgi:hypothetical protein